MYQPSLKKQGSDADNLANYHPIALIPLFTKTMEKIVTSQLQEHVIITHCLDVLHSSFGVGHSTGLAMATLWDNVLVAADNGSPSVLVLLDFSVTFDTVDHDILIQRLKEVAGATTPALKWFKSFVEGHSQCVRMGPQRSARRAKFGDTTGVPIVPVLFNMYLKQLLGVVRQSGIKFHSYANDTNLYIELPHQTNSAVCVLNRATNSGVDAYQPP